MSGPNIPDLRAFVERLRQAGDLATIDVPVSAELEVAEIHRRVIAAGGPALLFTSVEGSSFPLITNLFGTERRAQMAFGEAPFALVRQLVATAETLFPPSAAKLWGMRDVGLQMLRIGTRNRHRGKVMQNLTRDVNLRQLPIITSWPRDGGPFVTLPLVYTDHPDGRGHNLGMYRLQVHDERTTGMHWQIGKGGGFHYAIAESRDQPLPATVYLGGPPALMLSAIAPLPENVPEVLLASLIAGGRIDTCPGPDGRTLIANAEFALMGRVPPHRRHPEGPFGDHYGYYSLQHEYPVFQIDSLAHRQDAIYPATVVGKPRQEDFFIGDLLQELLAPLFPLVMPGVVDLWSYGETGYHSLAAAVVKERYKREAIGSAFRILGEGQLALTKFLLVIDQPVDLRDFRSTLQHVLERTRPETDLFIFSNLSMDTLDYTGPRVNEGSKGVWLGLGDPVRELPQEFSARELPAGVTEVEVFCPGCLVVGATSKADDPELAERVARAEVFAAWPLVVISDEPRRAAASSMNFLWTTFTRFEPAADVVAGSCKVIRNHIAYAFPIVVDARCPPGFPEELFCDPDTAALVTRRWREYFPQGVEMGDSGSAHLDPV